VTSRIPSVSIIIPNWNGERLLRKNLPKVIQAVKLSSCQTEIIVVDDGSTDESVEYLKTQNSKLKSVCAGRTTTKNLKLKIVENKENRGFIYSCNRGVKEARGEVVVLLNNDVIPEKDFLRYVLPHFEDPKVFAVSFYEPNWSWAKIEWKKGFIEHSPGTKTNTTHVSAWASGGSAAFRKSIWQKLGGFDSLFAPFYWEDIDLSYRAWKRGYQIFWEPKAVVYHQHESTISRFSADYIRLISERNRLLFIWKNITSPRMMLEHKFWLGLKFIRNQGYFRPFLAALIKKPQILSRWLKEFKEKKVSDREIFDKLR